MCTTQECKTQRAVFSNETKLLHTSKRFDRFSRNLKLSSVVYILIKKSMKSCQKGKKKKKKIENK